MVFGYLPKYAISINNTIKMSDLLIYKKKKKEVIPKNSINPNNFHLRYHKHNNYIYHCNYGRRCPFGGCCKK